MPVHCSASDTIHGFDTVPCIRRLAVNFLNSHEELRPSRFFFTETAGRLQDAVRGFEPSNVPFENR